ncbi:two-component sensor histidine kinase, partial [Oscillospiraceae bacterium OttesenSCG-928-F05]|nr:two-component sensor histidine kinase [Oscillospiraceae bacterium OttesenSCG-928-F05]
MIGRLRRKFVLVNMICVFLILVMVFSVFCVTSYRQAVDETMRGLRTVVSRGENQRPPAFMPGGVPPEEFFRSPVFVLLVAEDGGVRVVLQENIDVSEAAAWDIARAAAESDEPEGILADYDLRYIKREVPGGTRIAFMHRFAEQRALRNSLLTAAGTMTFALCGFFLISVFLAKWVLRPVEKAWEQQRRFIADASHEL